MSIGLLGAHRTGKSSLAESYSLHTGAPLLLLNSGDVFQKMGLDPAKTLSPEDRMNVQEALLDYAIEQYSQEREFFISDRTPLDFLAYTLLNLSRAERLSDAIIGRFMQYQTRCIEATNAFFSLLVLIQPGIPMKPALNKGRLCVVEQRILNETMKGFLTNPELLAQKRIIGLWVLNLQDRLNVLIRAKNAVLAEHISGTHEPPVVH